MSEYARTILTNLGLNPDVFTPNQIDAIMQPFDAPENYAHDGEVSPAEAKELWKNLLRREGIADNIIRRLSTIV